MKLDKLKTKSEIKKISDALRKKGKTIVTANGSFDILHAGHIRFLKEAKQQGDVLIVGLNSDKSVKVYKGKERPIIPEMQRAELLDAICYVDYIVLFDQPEIAVPLVTLVRPHVHCNGAQYGSNCVEASAVRKIGARLHLIKEQVVKNVSDKVSTTAIINKILRVYGKK